MSETVWIMNSKCCCRCGALLAYFEPIMCTDCLENAMYDAEQERHAVYDDEDEQSIDTLETEKPASG